MDAAEKMMRNARRGAVINGTILILAGPLWALMPVTDPDHAWWLRIALALLYLAIGSGAGCALLWWGLRNRPAAAGDTPETKLDRM